MITGHNKVKSRKAFLTKNQKNKLSKKQKKGQITVLRGILNLAIT